MNLNDAIWDRGCCAATLQLNDSDAIVLVTHTYATDAYRIERYVNNRLVSEEHDLTRDRVESEIANLT